MSDSEDDFILRGRPNSLYVLDYGLFQVREDGRIIGLCGFLIRTDRGESVLIDGGLPAKYANDPTAAQREDKLEEFGTVLNCSEANRPEAQLALAGLSPEDITLSVLSHSHIDHLGALEAFPNAPTIIGADERALPRPLYWGDASPMEWPDRRWITINADRKIAPGFTILSVPGHTSGQLAFLLELPETGPVVLTSDAISRPAEIEGDFSDAWNPAQAGASAKRLLDIADETSALVIWGHCPRQWPSLPKAPEALT